TITSSMPLRWSWSASSPRAGRASTARDGRSCSARSSSAGASTRWRSAGRGGSAPSRPSAGSGCCSAGCSSRFALSLERERDVAGRTSSGRVPCHPPPLEILGFGLLATAIVAAAVLLVRATRAPAALPPGSLESVARHLGQLQAEIARVATAQDQLRHDVHRGREASLRELADATQGLRGEIGAAQRALAEVKALEQGRARQMEQAAESLRRLEAVVAGSGSRGAAGENILARALG